MHGYQYEGKTLSNFQMMVLFVVGEFEPAL